MMTQKVWEQLQHDRNNGWEGMHSPEPWDVRDPDMLMGLGWLGGGMWITAAPGSQLLPQESDLPSGQQNVCNLLPHSEESAADTKRANAARIVACVNFCRGFSTEALTETTLREVLEDKGEW